MKLVERDGIHAAIISDGRVLILKRMDLPIIRHFITHPGKWYFVTGGRKNNERHIDAAYREIREETGLLKSNLELLADEIEVTITDRDKGIYWKNEFFVFRSNSQKVKLNFENTQCKWLDFQELAENEDIKEMLVNRDEILAIMMSHMR